MKRTCEQLRLAAINRVGFGPSSPTASSLPVGLGAVSTPYSSFYHYQQIRSITATTNKPPSPHHHSPPSSKFEGLRAYFYYTNERGDLYNVYNTEDGFFDAVVKLEQMRRHRKGADTLLPPPLSRELLRAIPSGPSHLKDKTFLDFFLSNLRLFSTDPAKCRDVGRSERYKNFLLHSSPQQEASVSGDDGKDAAGAQQPSSPIVTSNDTTRRLNKALGQQGKDELDVCDIFPYVSLCGKELNFIACENEPIVFYDLVEEEQNTASSSPLKNNTVASSSDNSDSGKRMVLQFGGTLQEPFEPKSLVVDEEGYLYHPVKTLNTNPAPRRERSKVVGSEGGKEEGEGTVPLQQQWGLVGASVGFKLGFEYMCEDKDQDGNFVIEWDGVKTPVPLKQ